MHRDLDWIPELPRVRCVVLIADVVGSVALVRDTQARFIDRWRRFVRDVRADILPATRGRMVKSLGDGMLCVFDDARGALDAAFRLQQRALDASRGWPIERAIWLRIGANLDVVEVDEVDIFGAGVDLAQRVLSVARPGEVVVTAAVRDEIVDGVDAMVEDLGECYLKHIDEPQRCFRLLPPLPDLLQVVPVPAPDASVLQLTVAVLPFQPLSPTADLGALGDLLADQVSTSLSRTPFLRVISRLSCAAVAEREFYPRAVGRRLGARYLLCGSVITQGERVVVHAEVIDPESGSVAWSTDSRTTLAEVLAGQDPAVGDIVQGAGRAIIERELLRQGGAPLPTLKSHQLLLSAIAHIHRSSPFDFDRARTMLELLADRHARLPQGHSWLANWHAMHAVQGLCDDPAAAGRRAVDHANRALDADGNSSLAWTMRGLVQGFLRKDLAAAEHDYQAAIQANPSESLAWLYMGTLRAWQGRGSEALAPAQEALRLAPVGPLRYYFESLAGLAALAAGDNTLAAELSTRSMRTNRLHTSTHRTLAIAQWKLQQYEAARSTVAEMLRVEPGFTADAYARRFPGGDIAFARENAGILIAAGAPAH